MEVKIKLRHARRRVRAEAGFALPTVMLGTIAAMGLGSAMVTSSLSATAGTERDKDTKSAFAVSEAGVSHALLRYNRFDTTAYPCINEGAGGQVVLEAAQANGWCRPVTVNSSGGSFSYSVKPGATGLTIVSTGFFDGLTRRVKVFAKYEAQPGNGGIRPFEDVQVIGKDAVTINNGSSINADVGTQGLLTVGNGGKLYCGKAQAASTSFAKGAPCTVSLPDFELPAVDSSVAKVDNDNALLPGSCRSWNATSKLLTITCSTTFGVSGQTQDFYVCKLTNNSTINVAAGATVNFWFAPPSECGGNTVPIVLPNGSKIRTPAGGPPSTLAFIVSDSPTVTSIAISAGGWGNWPEEDDNLVIYAPTSNVTMSNGQHMYASIASKTISTASGGSFTKTSLGGTWELPGSTGGPTPHYVSSEFLECTPTNSTSTPDAGC